MMPALLTSTPNAAKSPLCSVEHGAHRARVADVGLTAIARPPLASILRANVSADVHRRKMMTDGEAVSGHTLRHRAPMPREAPVTIATLMVFSVSTSPQAEGTRTH